MAKTLNPLTETPIKKAEVTKPFMFAFMQSHKATKEDLDWFINVCENNKRIYKNKFTGADYEDIDIPKVRAAFVERFYPNLSVKKKKKKSFVEELKLINK